MMEKKLQVTMEEKKKRTKKRGKKEQKRRRRRKRREKKWDFFEISRKRKQITHLNVWFGLV
jgi:hypothetical protein